MYLVDVGAVVHDLIEVPTKHDGIKSNGSSAFTPELDAQPKHRACELAEEVFVCTDDDGLDAHNSRLLEQPKPPVVS